jgi:hypothetical protein
MAASKALLPEICRENRLDVEADWTVQGLFANGILFPGCKLPPERE